MEKKLVFRLEKDEIEKIIKNNIGSEINIEGKKVKFDWFMAYSTNPNCNDIELYNLTLTITE